jgi:hypothetical protein
MVQIVGSTWGVNYRRRAQLRDGPYGYRYYTIVYAIEAPEVGRIKFGRTMDVDKRFRALAGSSPTEIKLLGHLWAPDEVEANIHQYLQDDRSHGEWFLATGKVRQIADLIVGKKLQALCEEIEAGYLSRCAIRPDLDGQ